jgi:hypothetical protein
VAVTAKSPFPVALRTPVVETDAGAPDETVHAAVEVTSLVDPSLYLAVAVSWSLSPMSREVPGAEMATLWMDGGGGGGVGGVTGVDPLPLHEIRPAPRRDAPTTTTAALEKSRKPELARRRGRKDNNGTKAPKL